LAAELPFLEEAFDEIVIISNDISSPQTWPVGSKVRVERRSYVMSPLEKIMALRGIFDPVVLSEFRSTRRSHPAAPFKGTAALVLSSWAKARRFAAYASRIVADRPGSTVCAYSYWANDMAVAVALARSSGIVHRAITRAHGWDIYNSRPEAGPLPFRDFIADNLDALLFVSEDGRASFDSVVKGGRAARAVVRIGTPPRADRPQGRGDVFTIVSCSVLIPLKRVELLARAIVASAIPIRWIHVGDGPERAQLERICSTAPANVRIELAGWLAGEEVIRTLRRLRPSALINVSSSEGIPVSMMEAMSLGIPVIGTAVGGVSEIITHGLNGHLLSKDPTPAEIASAIELFAEMSGGAFEELAAGAWRTWNERFRGDVNFRRLLAILDPLSIASGNGAEASTA